MVSLVKRRTYTSQGYTKVICWYSDGTKASRWFDRYGKVWPP